MRAMTTARRRLIAAAIGTTTAIALALPGAAGAGGFATVGLSSLPDGTPPGTPWHVTLTILQHGRTPLDGLKPIVKIRSADGGATRTFPAEPAGKPGLYTADVVFPSSGRWRYTVDDGFGRTQSFAPVAIGSSQPVAVPGSQSGAGPSGAKAPTVDSGGGNVAAAIGAAVVAGLLAALAAAVLVRRRDAAPAGR